MSKLVDWCAEHMAKPGVVEAIPMPPVVREALDELKAIAERMQSYVERLEAVERDAAERRECGISDSDPDAVG